MTYRRRCAWITLDHNAKPPSVDALRRRDEFRRELVRRAAKDPETVKAVLGTDRFGPEVETMRRDAEEAGLLVGIFAAQHRNPKLSNAAWYRAEAARQGITDGALKKRLEAARRRYHADMMFQLLVNDLANAELHRPPEPD
jgi:hypothetical protein